MNGKQRGRALAAPVHISRGQAGWPIVGVHQIGLPVDLRQVGGDISGGQAQAGKPNMVVGPVAAIIGAVGRALALVQFRANQHINDQAVCEVHAPDFARRQRGMAAEFADDVDRVIAVQHLPIAGDQHPHIVQMAHGPGQGG